MFIRFRSGDAIGPVFGPVKRAELTPESLVAFDSNSAPSKWEALFGGYTLATWDSSKSQWRISQFAHGGELWQTFEVVQEDVVIGAPPPPYFPPRENWALIRRTVAPNEHCLIGVFSSLESAKDYVEDSYGGSYGKWKEWFLEEGWCLELGSTMGYWVFPCRPTKAWGI